MGFFPTPRTMQFSTDEVWRRAQTRATPFEDTLRGTFLPNVKASFGLGTAIRELATPPLLTDAPIRGDTPENYRTRLERFKAEAMIEEEMRASPNNREGIPWERGMTEARLAVLAQQWDEQQVSARLAAGNPVGGFIGSFAGQAFDPINYIPVFGEATHAAVIAKAGLLGRAGIAASEAAVNTAAFSVLTASTRARYGDEVSFQGILNEIAMSALIGGAFGAGIGILGYGFGTSTKRKLRDVRTGMDKLGLKVKGFDLNRKAAKDLAEKGYVDLGQPELDTIQQTAAEIAARIEPERQLAKQTAGVAQAPERGKNIMTPEGDMVDVVPRIVEADSVTYAQGADQVRNTDAAASKRFVAENAPKLVPEWLGAELTTDKGAPGMGPDGQIDWGNHRAMMILEAYLSHPEAAAKYRAWLEAQGYDLAGLQRPMLVMERTTPLSPDARAAFNARSNAPTAQEMSATELANLDQMAMTTPVLAQMVPGPVTSAANRGFVFAFIQNLPKASRGRLIQADGSLSREGALRVENALVSIAYGTADPSVIRRFTEAIDDNSRAILGAMSDVAPRWARIARDIKAGELDPAFDPAPVLTEAVRRLNAWRDQAKAENRPVGQVIKEGLAQLDMLSGEINIPVKRMIEMFYRDESYRSAVGRDALAVLLDRIAENVEKLGQPQMFGRPGVSLTEVIEHATASQQADIFVDAGDLGLGAGSGAADRRAAVRAGIAESGGGPDEARPEGTAAQTVQSLAPPEESLEDALLGLGYNNPFNEMETVVHEGDVAGGITTRISQGKIWVSDLRALTRGGGRLALTRLLELADERGVTVELGPHPLESPGGIKMSKARLNKWYEDFGFKKVAGSVLRREPARPAQAVPAPELKLNDREFTALKAAGYQAEVVEDGNFTRVLLYPSYTPARVPKGPGRVGDLAYDPKLANVEVRDKGVEYIEHNVIRLKEGSGLSEMPTPLTDENIVYRGMSAAEYRNFLHDGFIQSHGEYNFAPQAGLTYWTTNIDSAAAYASSYAAAKNKPTFDNPAYIVAIRRPTEEVRVEGVGEHEVGVPRAVQRDEVVATYEGQVYGLQPGDYTARSNDDGSLRSIASSSPRAQVGWRTMRDINDATRPSRPTVAREADGSLMGLPRKIAGYEPSVYDKGAQVAADYMAKAGLEYHPPNVYVKVDPVRAAKIADAYDAMKHDPTDPEVMAAYQAMIKETMAQYQAMLDAGLVVEFNPPGGKDPYHNNPRNMTEDVRRNNHMWVFPTAEGFGSPDVKLDVLDNPLLGDSGLKFGDRPATYNDIFRAVHDYFGHAKEGVGFRADGEENAWRSHSAMYSPLARRAMTTETRGQNSWVNYGPFGDSNRTASSADTHYADQKIGLLPDWVVTEGAGDAVNSITMEAKGGEAPLGVTWTSFGGTGKAMLSGETATAMMKFHDMEDAGETPEAMYRETGIFRGIDGKIRFEIRDEDAEFRDGIWRDPDGTEFKHAKVPAGGKVVGYGNTVMLGAALKADKLFAAYPMLRTVPIRMVLDPSGPQYGGGFDGHVITVQGKTELDVYQTLMHEVQHVIQMHEDFAFGGNEWLGEVYAGPRVAEAQQQIAALKAEIIENEKIAGNMSASVDATVKRDRANLNLISLEIRLRKAQNNLIASAKFEFYQLIAGEVEARNVSGRALLVGDSKQIPPPWATEDRPRDQQVITVYTPGGPRVASTAFDSIGQQPLPERAEEGEPLPYAPDRYFLPEDGQIDVPISQVEPTRARPEGIKNAGGFMRQAYNGEKSRREPVSLRLNPDGTYSVLDGNSTYANAVQSGWPMIRGKVFTEAQFAEKERSKAAAKAAKKAAPEPGVPKVTEVQALPPDGRRVFWDAVIAKVSHPTFDDLYDAAERWQPQLVDEVKRIRDELGIAQPIKFATVKKRDTAFGKIARKNYQSHKQLTDVVRDSMALSTPDQAAKAIKLLGEKWGVIDEGWNVTDLGYFDRKALVQFPDGTLGEIQFLIPEIETAKKSVEDGGWGGHALYERWRLIPDDEKQGPAALAIEHESNALYSRAMSLIGPEWEDVVRSQREAAMGKPASGNILENSSAEMRLPESTTSAASTLTQLPESLAQAPEPSTSTAGRYSQSKNLSDAIPDDVEPQLDLSRMLPPRQRTEAEMRAMGYQLDQLRNLGREGFNPTPAGNMVEPPEGMDEVEAKVGKPETADETAETLGLDPETGDFDEMAEYEALKDEGLTTPEDEAAMERADEDHKKSKAYANALKAGVNCLLS